MFFLTEGAIFDWFGIFLKTRLQVDVSAAGVVYAAFSLPIASVRLCGDFGRRDLGVSPIVGSIAR